MKAIGIAAAIGLMVSAVSSQLFAQAYTTMDTVYTPAGYPEGPLQATIYIPSSPNGIGVVLAHWLTGTRQTPHAWCEAFAGKGYAAMTIDYYDFSFSVNSRYPKPIRAYKTAIEFLRLNADRFRIFTGKIVGFGQSEGSIHWGEAITENHDDAFLGIDSLVADSVDAAVLMYGAYDNEQFLQSSFVYNGNDFNGVLTGYFTDYPNFRATKGNCIANVDSIHCPVLLFHGPIDEILPYQQSLELRDSMTTHRKKVELLSNNSWDHAFDLDGTNNAFTAQGLVARDSVFAFLSRALQVKDPVGTVAEDVRVPAQFSLRQNYPNPFNPSTTIQFSIPRAAHVALSIFNTLGQEVATLVSEELSPGAYTRQWNAAQTASGIYFCRLQAGGFTETKKLVVVR